MVSPRRMGRACRHGGSGGSSGGGSGGRGGGCCGRGGAGGSSVSTAAANALRKVGVSEVTPVTTCRALTVVNGALTTTGCGW
jgi:hypothetical protein